MKINEILPTNEYISATVDINTEITSVSTSPTETEEGCLLILENSKRLQKSFKFKTKPTAIVTDDPSVISDDIPYILTNTPRKASAVIHSNFYNIDYSRLKTIGVTGTNGKTSTAYMIYKILLDNKRNCGFIGSGLIEIGGTKINDTTYSMTTPDISKLYKIIRKMQDENCSYIVMEVSSHALALDKVYPIPFDYGVFTNLSSEHMDFHNTMDDYFNCKLKLIKSAKKAVLNIDDAYARKIFKTENLNPITIGALWQGDYYATSITQNGFSELSYFLHTKDICYKTTLHFPGIYNVYNSMLATAVCIDLGIRPCKVKKSVSGITKIKGRFEVINGPVKVIIDYAHTAKAYESFLQSLISVKGKSSLTVVFGCGGDRDKTKRPMIASIVERYANRIIVTEDNSRKESFEDISKDIASGFNTENFEVIKDRTEAIRSAILKSKPGDIVAVIGKGCEEYNIKGESYDSYNDKIEVANALYEFNEKENEN